VKFSALLLFCLPLLAAAAPFTAIGDGEKLTYKVGFAIFSHAGDITIAGKSDTSAGKHLARVTADSRSSRQSRRLHRGLGKTEA